MGLLRNSVFLVRLVLAVSLLLPSFVYADPPAAAPTASFNAPSFSGGGQGNQGTTGQSGSNSSGSGATNGQTGSNSTGGSTRQNSSSPVTNPEDSSATQPTNSFVAPNTEDLLNDPRGIQVINLFKEVLSREPNSRELADRVGDLVNNRTTLDAMRSELLASDERYKLQINALYRKYLGRPIDRPAWESLVQRRPHPSLDAVKAGLAISNEYKKRQIVDLYIKHLDRAPDPKGLQALLEANAGRALDVLQLENDLRFSTEYATSWYINAFAQRLKKCPSKVELQAIVPLLKSKKATYAETARFLDAQVPRGYDGYPLVNNDPTPLVCPNAFDSATNEARTQLTNYVLTSVQIKISSPRDFQIADLKNRLANLRAEIEKQSSLLNGTQQNISNLKKQLDELSWNLIAGASGTTTAAKRNLDGMRDLETEQAARLEQLQQSARTLERIIAEFEGGGGDDDLYYSAPNERLRTVITTDASREADRRFGEELSQASYKLAIAEGGLKATQQGLVSAAVIGTVVMSGGATLPVLFTATANGTVIGFIASRSEAVGQVSAGNLTYTEAHDKATKDFLRYTGQAATTAGSMLVGGVAKAGVLGLGRATASRMVAGSVQQYRVAYWTPSAAFFASGSASAAVGSTISNAPRWYSGEKSAAEIAQMIGVDMLFGGAAGLTGGNIKNLMADAAVDLSLATVQSFLKGEIDPNKPQETTEAILGNLISTATSSASAKYKQNLDTQRNSGGSGSINNTTAPLTSDGIIREAISNLVPKGTLDAIMQNVKNDVLQGTNISKILPVEILVRIPGLDPIKKPQEYKAAYDAVSKALEQATVVADQKSGGAAPINNANAPQSSDAILREAITKLAPKGTLDAVMEKIQQDVLQKGDVTNVLPVDILSRIPGLDPIKKAKEYQAAVDAISKALEQARLEEEAPGGKQDIPGLSEEAQNFEILPLVKKLHPTADPNKKQEKQIVNLGTEVSVNLLGGNNYVRAYEVHGTTTSYYYLAPKDFDAVAKQWLNTKELRPTQISVRKGTQTIIKIPQEGIGSDRTIRLTDQQRNELLTIVPKVKELEASGSSQYRIYRKFFEKVLDEKNNPLSDLEIDKLTVGHLIDMYTANDKNYKPENFTNNRRSLDILIATATQNPDAPLSKFIRNLNSMIRYHDELALKSWDNKQPNGAQVLDRVLADMYLEGHKDQDLINFFVEAYKADVEKMKEAGAGSWNNPVEATASDITSVRMKIFEKAREVEKRKNDRTFLSNPQNRIDVARANQENRIKVAREKQKFTQNFVVDDQNNRLSPIFGSIVNEIVNNSPLKLKDLKWGLPKFNSPEKPYRQMTFEGSIPKPNDGSIRKPEDQKIIELELADGTKIPFELEMRFHTNTGGGYYTLPSYRIELSRPGGEDPRVRYELSALKPGDPLLKGVDHIVEKSGYVFIKYGVKGESDWYPISTEGHFIGTERGESTRKQDLGNTTHIEYVPEGMPVGD